MSAAAIARPARISEAELIEIENRASAIMCAEWVIEARIVKLEDLGAEDEVYELETELEALRALQVDIRCLIDLVRGGLS